MPGTVPFCIRTILSASRVNNPVKPFIDKIEAYI